MAKPIYCRERIRRNTLPEVFADVTCAVDARFEPDGYLVLARP